MTIVLDDNLVTLDDDVRFLARITEMNAVIAAYQTNTDIEGTVAITAEQYQQIVAGGKWKIIDGALIEYVPPAPPLTQADYAAAIQALLDAKARERQYDGIHTAIGYRDDPNPNFAAEARELFIWRSAVWTYSSAELAKVTDGERPQPTVSEFMTELEAACPFVWPMQRPAMLGGQLPVE